MHQWVCHERQGTLALAVNHWIGLVECIGMDYWTEPFPLKIIFMLPNKICSDHLITPKPRLHVVKEVCATIVKLLLPSYIQIPTGSALKDIVDGFKTNHGFPQCAGAVDGCHIPIVSPQECPADYYNRKGWHSIIFQGTVDDRGRFIDMYVGPISRLHRSGCSGHGRTNFRDFPRYFERPHARAGWKYACLLPTS